MARGLICVALKWWQVPQPQPSCASPLTDPLPNLLQPRASWIFWGQLWVRIILFSAKQAVYQRLTKCDSNCLLWLRLQIWTFLHQGVEALLWPTQWTPLQLSQRRTGQLHSDTGRWFYVTTSDGGNHFWKWHKHSLKKIFNKKGVGDLGRNDTRMLPLVVLWW